MNPNAREVGVFCIGKNPSIEGMRTLEALAERLRQLRFRHDLTQQQAASAAGLSFKFYQSLESGRKKDLRLSTLQKLAEAYGIDEARLLGPETPSGTQVAKSVLMDQPPHYRRRRGPYRSKRQGAS